VIVGDWINPGAGSAGLTKGTAGLIASTASLIVGTAGLKRVLLA